MGFLAMLAGLAAPIAARVLMALGFSVVTFAGMDLLVEGLIEFVLGKIGAAPIAGLQLAGLAGVWDGLGMTFGAVTFTVSLWGLTRAVRIVNGT